MSLNTILATTPLVSTGYHLKATGTTIGNSLIWDNGTNVGIGNTNTSYTLDVSGSLRNTTSAYFATTSGGVGMGTTNTTYATLNVKASSTQLYNGIAIYSTNGTESFFGIGNSGSVVGFDATYGASGAYLPIAFNVGGSERLRITTAGNVGIGTSVPFGKLTISKTTPPTTYTAADMYINLGYTESGASSTRLIGFGYNGAGTEYPSTYLGYITTNTAAGEYGDLIFGTRNNTSSAVQASERMRITSGGSVIVQSVRNNTFASSGNLQIFDNTNNIGWGFQNNTFNNLVVFSYNGVWNTVGYFTNGTGVYVALSDANKKKDFEDSTIGLKEVLQLKPTLYRMKSEDETTDKHLGFIAQEVKDLIPQAYNQNGQDGDDDIFIGLTEMPIIAALTKAIQEMNTKLDAQNQTIQNLQEQINILAK